MFNESPKGFPKVWTWYSTFTSVEGLVQFFASKNAISKAYWLIILVAATVATSINVFNVFEDFLSYPVVTDVKVIQNSSIEFPSVTICNTNRVHCGNLLKYVSTCQNSSEKPCDEDRHKLLCELYFLLDCSYSVTVSENFHHGNPKSDIDHCGDDFVHQDVKNKTDKEIEQYFYDIYLKLKPQEIITIAHQSASMIKSCAFSDSVDDKACLQLTSSRPRIYVSPRYGVCYSFNFVLEYEQENVSSSNSDGPDYGLSLVIDIEKSQYMRRGMSTKEGVIIALASKSQSPNLLASPLQISTSAETNVAITLQENTRLESPYQSQCLNSYPSQVEQWIKDSNVTSYSDLKCRRHCMNHFIKGVCDCVDPLSLDVELVQDFSLVKFCSVTYNTTDRKCVTEARNDYMNYSQSEGNTPCGCGVDCLTTKYMISTSSNIWPSEYYWGKLAEKYGIKFNGSSLTYRQARDMISLGEKPFIYDKIKEHISSNYLKVNIYFETLGMEIIYEIPEYTSNSFLSALGGALSIYQGLTLLTMFEFFELIVRLVKAALNLK